MHTLATTLVLLLLTAATADALECPGLVPGAATGEAGTDHLTLSNDMLRCRWNIDAGTISSLAIIAGRTNQRCVLTSGHMPQVVLPDGRVFDLAKSKWLATPRLEDVSPDRQSVQGEASHGGKRFSAEFLDPATGLEAHWSAELRDGSNYLIQVLDLSATTDTKIVKLVMMDATIDGAKQVGEVDGSVVVRGDLFLAVEHPMAKNEVGVESRVRCALPRDNVLKAGRTWRCAFVTGVSPPEQLRRGFLYYLERRRAHPYRPFLHYNSWYHLNLGRPNHSMTEAECLATIERFGRELVENRNVAMDAFVWDDGWDDFDSLWGFHAGFPNGFRNLQEAGAKYGAAQGVWMSPWGGYGASKTKRLAHGASQGYETNRNGFSMAGPKYQAAFRDVCLNMMRQNGVVFFKFDGMGTGGGAQGAKGVLGDDVDAVLDLTRVLRRENPNVFLSATVGTWASPFWTFYADSVWRQGGDTGFYGWGDTRQQWITYRDMHCYRRVVRQGPLYPLNSLMLHGVCIGERGEPGKMDRNEKSVADEIWTFFGSGTHLQELYISPHLLTPNTWNELAAAIQWSRANANALTDAHWIGGDPASGDVYGWASWQPGKGILVLRNPSDRSRRYELDLTGDLEIPKSALPHCVVKSPRQNQRVTSLPISGTEPFHLELKPFEVLVFEVTVPDLDVTTATKD